MATDVTVPGLPVPLEWLRRPERWEVDDNGLLIEAGAGTDLFTDPSGEAQFATAPALLATVEGDFMLSARVGGGLTATFDAAVLLLYTDERTWAKCCLEVSPQGSATIVSVVNRGVSDDCNSFPVTDREVRLRISRLGRAYAFHVQTGQDPWQLVRYFALDGAPAVGFLAQSPTGAGCAIRFEEIAFRPERLVDLRGGA